MTNEAKSAPPQNPVFGSRHIGRPWRVGRTVLISILALIALRQTYRQQYPLPGETVPAGLGVNVHFIDPGETLDRIAEAGFKWIRTDFSWSQIERSEGSYDFAEYDKLVSGLKRAQMRAILVLDYGNTIYQEGSPRSERARKAFVRWVHASLQHFRHEGIVWEMYNEPNIRFWKPAPNAGEYARLALDVGEEIRRNEPDEWYIGPAVSGMDLAFVRRCFDAGLLVYWDAVSVHPYRGHRPETVLDDYRDLREAIEEYTPNGLEIPIICSEWGYPDTQYPEELQADFLAREYLCGLMARVPITVWYDWSDDAYDPNAVDESHFGVVAHDGGEKRGFAVVSGLVKALKGWKLAETICAKPYLYLLKFSRGGKTKYVAWCWDEHTETFPIPAGSYTVVPWGGVASFVEASGGGMKLDLGPDPVVIEGR